MNDELDFLTLPKFVTLSKDNLKEITEIEALSNKPSWTEDMFSSEFKKDNAKFYGVILNDKVVGFLLINTVADEAHILKFGVLPEYRGKGVGKRLLSFSLTNISNMKIKYAWLEVRKSNNIAINLYSRFNFTVKGERKEYYTDNNEDAYTMVLLLDKKNV